MAEWYWATPSETNVMAREPDPQSEEDLPVGRLIKELADPETRELIAAAVISS